MVTTQLLLQQMAQEGEFIGTRRSDQQVMALGSFRAHLLLGLQALREAQYQPAGYPSERGLGSAADRDSVRERG